MLHLLYILAFTTLAFLAIGNLIRSMFLLGVESQRSSNRSYRSQSPYLRDGQIPHPELLDDTGSVVSEPLLVMRSMTVEDAREQLDALYESSPGKSTEPRDDA